MPKTARDYSEELEAVLDQQFPKGDKARGRALMLFAHAMIHIRDAMKGDA